MKKIISVLFLVFALAWNVNSQTSSDFELWQLPSQINTIGNSNVFRTADGKIAVMDGGVSAEASYLRGFLAALGNKVDIWFISHPHPDHIGALSEILKDPRDLKIEKICHSGFSSQLSGAEPDYRAGVEEFYVLLEKSGIPVVNVREAGLVILLDQTQFKILGVTNEDILVNPYNNSSMIIRVWDKSKSMLFLGDCGKEEGDRLLSGPYRKELDCDYISTGQ